LFNPSINWGSNHLEGEDIIIETAGYCTKPKPQTTAIHFTPPSDQLETQKLIPEQYHQHWRVFSEEAAQCFPPSRLDDHAIELKLGAPADCKIYRQTETELKALKEYIDENLAKGYIIETNSPYASPVFFHAKKDGKLRPIVDY
jgi:hypothetical protein